MNNRPKNKPSLTQAALLAVSAAMILSLSACSSTGNMKGGGTDTTVGLNRNNYKILKAGAMGQSSGFWLLGFIPLASPDYASAKSDLYRSSGVSLTGKAAALANQTEDKSTLYLILFSIPRVTITADIIEFSDTPAPAAAAPTQ